MKDKLKRLRGRKAWVGMLGVALVLAMLATAFPVHVTRDSLHTGEGGVLTVGRGQYHITIGTPVSATTADYTCDGTDDDVQFQAALDALPASGGQLLVLTGDYDFENGTTVTRAIDDVSIIGVGASVSFTCDATTAIFTAGGNSWLFSNFETDAGGLAMGATTDWMWLNITIGTTYYALDTEDDPAVDTSGTPADDDFAKFTDADTVEGRSYAEVRTDLGLVPDTDVPAQASFDDHSAEHENAGADEISVAGLSGLLADDQHVLDAEVQAIKLDDFATPDDNTDLDSSLTEHGLLLKLGGGTTNFLRADGTWAAPAGGGDVTGPAASTDHMIARHDGAGGKTLIDYASNPPTISDTGDMNIDGDLDVENIVVSGNVDGRDVSADGTKLDGVEASADVTDATNVNAAGAVMEVDYNVHSILIAVSDDTPVVLSVGEQTLVGRLTGGNIAAVSIGITDNYIVQIDSAGVADNEYARFTANGLESRTEAEFKGDFNLEAGTDYPSLTTFDDHSARHENGGADEMSVTGLSGLLADDQHVLDAEVQAIKLDDFATPDDNTDLDSSLTEHGLLPKLGGGTTNFFRADGTWAVPAGGGTVDTSGTPVDDDFAKFTDADTIEGRSYAEVKADLSLEIGTDVQAYDATLASIADLGTAGDKMAYTTALDTWTEAGLTSFARSILDDADEATFKATVNLEIGTDVLAEQTIGIADDNLVEMDDADAADNDYMRLTADGLEGRDYSEVRSDLAVLAIADIDDSPVDAETSAPISSNWAYDHDADGSAHQSNVITITLIIDGGGSAITTGEKGHLEIPFACTITGWTILADQSGSIVIDVWNDTYANFPPTDADSVAGTELPTLSSAQKNQDLALGSWTTAVTAGDILAYNVDSVATVERITLSIRATKT